MDVDTCVALHNKILEIGWLGSGRSREELEQTCKPWFDYYGDEAEDVRAVLLPDLTAFLEQANDVGYNTHIFTYYVGGLNSPASLFEDAEIFNEILFQGDTSRFVVLYYMNCNFASHPVGLVYDQHNSSAIMCECIDDCTIISNGRITWHPLETVLEAWLDMIEKGKFIITTEDSDKKPWKLAPYGEQILQESVDVFNCLVDEIESRLPRDDTRMGEAFPPLVEETVLEAIDLGQGFASHFVRKAKRPRFRFIAPGLAAPDADSISEQPFASFASSEDVEAFPILLFRAIDGATTCMAPISRVDSLFGRPFDQVKQYPAGLYLSCQMPSYYNAFEDECTLVLPFRIGARGYARTSDGALFGEDKEFATEVVGRDTFEDLYQPGYNPFIKGHGRQLVHVLKNWLAMIREGHWKVDADGVVGGMEEWRKADTEKKYVIPVTW